MFDPVARPGHRVRTRRDLATGFFGGGTIRAGTRGLILKVEPGGIRSPGRLVVEFAAGIGTCTARRRPRERGMSDSPAGTSRSGRSQTPVPTLSGERRLPCRNAGSRPPDRSRSLNMRPEASIRTLEASLMPERESLYRLLRTVLLRSVIVIALSGIVAGCGGAATGARDGDALTEIAPATIVTPPERPVIAVVDASPSYERDYLKKGLHVLADAVRAVPGDVPDRGAFPGRAGLHLSLRVIGQSSYTAQGLVLDEHVPGVPAIGEIRPDANGEFSTQDALNVTAQRKAAVTASGEAERAADALAERLDGLDLDQTSCSDVEGSISAAAESLNETGAKSGLIVVLSDFGQTCNENVSGSLAGIDVLAVLSCDTSAQCDARKQAWDRRFAEARSHRFIRLEDAAGAVADAIAGDLR
jgi:hypothetical protein